MKTYRITKYDPDNRDENGRYLVDEWTSISDIGKEYNGKVFNEPTYISIEDKYVEAIEIILAELKIDSLKVKSLEKYSIENNPLYSEDLLGIYKSLSEDDLLSKKEILLTVRLALRENLWCTLEDERSRLFLRFGHDYYMYVSIQTNQISVVEKINIEGLFIEEHPLGHSVDYSIE